MDPEKQNIEGNKSFARFTIREKLLKYKCFLFYRFSATIVSHMYARAEGIRKKWKNVGLSFSFLKWKILK